MFSLERPAFLFYFFFLVHCVHGNGPIFGLCGTLMITAVNLCKGSGFRKRSSSVSKLTAFVL